jgi:N-methylhydantoinase A
MRVLFDIGGTFTDVIILHDDRTIETRKLLSLTEELGGELISMLERSAKGETVECFVHATTICSNAIIERKVGSTALVTTRGFRDVLEMMNQLGPSIYNVQWQRLEPLIPRSLRYEITERILADGTVDTPVDLDDLARVANAIERSDIAAIAVCLVHSYVNSDHEELARQTLQDRFPNVYVCVSSEVDPQAREYERTSTTTINASLLPVVNRYLDDLGKSLDAYSQDFRIMQSNGGTMSLELARRRPMQMVESGPAAGVLGAAKVAEMLELEEALSFDMGGTTAKACLIEAGRPREKIGGEIGASISAGEVRGFGHSLRVPSLDIVEVGAGGGSIAWLDTSAALRVGPVSASADPGPACYGRGGTEPTVTDANLILGYINPEAIANDTLNLNARHAAAAIEGSLVETLGVDTLAVAHGIVSIANSTMVRALRAVSVERGRDIRSMALIAFGGSGPLHAAMLAEAVGITRVVIPPFPGVFSAVGLMLADTRVDYVQNVEKPLASISDRELLVICEEMEARAGKEAIWEAADSVRFDFLVDLRLGYQQAELTLNFSKQRVEELESLFHTSYLREYGFAGEGILHLANVRMRASRKGSDVELGELSRSGSKGKGDTGRVRRAYFGAHGLMECRILDRSLISGALSGPLLIDEASTTIVVPPGWFVAVDRLENVILTWGTPDEESIDGIAAPRAGTEQGERP